MSALRRALGAAACLALACLGPTACTPSDAPAPTDASDTAMSGYRVCLLLDPAGGSALNDQASAALQAAHEADGVQVATQEISQLGAAASVEQAASGCNLILGVGATLLEPLAQAASGNDSVDFALLDAPYAFGDDADADDLPANLKVELFDTAQGTYLAGYAAAGASKTGVVAVFGGADQPQVRRAMDGFVSGVEAYNTAAKAHVTVLGWNRAAQRGSFTSSMSDPKACRTMTDGFIDQGADVIVPIAGAAQEGAFAAAREAKAVRIVAVGPDWAAAHPDDADHVFTSVVTDPAAPMRATIEEGANGKFTSTPYVGTLANMAVHLADFPQAASLPDGLLTAVSHLSEKLSAGALTP